METPRDVPLSLRPESRPVLFSGGRPLPASCYMLAGFTSRSVLSGPWSPTPCQLVLKFVHESRVCMTVLFQSMHAQALAFAGSFHFAKSGPYASPSLSRCSITGSRTRAEQVEWCQVEWCTVYWCRSIDVLYMFAIRSAPFPTGSATAQRGPTAARPCSATAV